MPASPHFAHEFASSLPAQQTQRALLTKLTKWLDDGWGYKLTGQTDNTLTFTRRYWPGPAIAGLILGWAAAAYGYSNAQNSLDGTVSPGVYIAAAIAIGCIFVRRTEDLRFTFEPRQAATVVFVNGNANGRLQRHLRELPEAEDLPAEALAPASPSPPPPAPSAREDGGDVVGQLERLVGLRERGALTDAEFQRQKAKLLADA